MACLLLSAPPCLAPISYILYFCLSIVFRLWCTEHPSHSFSRISLAYFASVSLVLVFAGAPLRTLMRGYFFFDDNLMIPIPDLIVCVRCVDRKAASFLPFIEQPQQKKMADIQALLAALDVFSRAPDKASLEKANAWLQDFQHSVNTISPVAHRLRPLTRHHPIVLIV
jgi:hypothetical protein